MAHGSQLKFIRLLSENFSDHFHSCRVLEIGSLDINGSIRQFFSNCEYVGLDVAAGKGVDVVCEGQKYDASDESFDVVVSCNVMEHNPYWAETFRNMIRLCRPGGLVVMTCAGTGFPEHGTARTDPNSSPLTVGKGWNYYRNLTERDFRRAVDVEHELPLNCFWVNWRSFDLSFVGIKRQTSESALSRRWSVATSSIDEWITAENALPAHRIRAAMASIFGETWFKSVAHLKSVVKWLLRGQRGAA